MRPVTDALDWMGGFIAAEGCFVHSGTGFAMRVALGASDAATCLSLQQLLGVGSVRSYTRRKPHYDDEVVYSVGSISDLLDAVVPFLDEHLPPSYKRGQYEKWREALIEHWATRHRRTRPCTVPGCEQTSRAKGLCRHHYYEAFGR